MDVKPVFVDEISFLNMREKVLAQMEKEYGWLGAKLTGTEIEFKFDYVPIPSNMPAEQKARAQAQNDELKQNRIEWNDKAPKIFNKLLDLCSEYCKLKLKRDELYQQAYETRNPVKLWKIMERIFIPSEEIRNRKYLLERDKLRSIKQGNMSYEDFIAAFEKQLEIFTQVGGNIEGADICEFFIDGLDKFKHHKAIVKMKKPGIKTYYAAKDKLVEVERSMEGITAINEEYTKTLLSNLQRQQQESKQQIALLNRTQSNKRYKGSDNDKETHNKKVRFNKLSKSFKKSKDNRIMDKKSLECIYCKKKGLPYKVWNSHDLNRCKNIDKDTKPNESVHTIFKTDEHFEDPTFSDTDFVGAITTEDTNRSTTILDTGATVNAYNNQEALLSISEDLVGIHFSQLKGRSHRIKDIGISPEWGKGIYIPEARYNVISMSVIKEFCKIEYNSEQDVYKIYNKNTGNTFKTKTTSNGLYEILKEETGLLVAMHSNNVEKFRRLDQSDQARNRRVWKLHRVLDHPYTPALIKSLAEGSFASWEISPKDVKKARLEDCILRINANLLTSSTDKKKSAFLLFEDATNTISACWCSPISGTGGEILSISVCFLASILPILH